MYALTRVRNLGWNNVKSYEIWMALKHRLSSHSRTLLRISNMFLASPYHAQKNFYSDLKSRVITQKLKLFKKFCFILSFTCTKSTMKYFGPRHTPNPSTLNYYGVLQTSGRRSARNCQIKLEILNSKTMLWMWIQSEMQNIII